MAVLEGIQIKNFRALKNITLGRVLTNKQAVLPRLVAIIGANGTGKSSILDALGFLGDCLNEGVEAACDKPHRAGFDKLRSLGSTEAMQFEIRYRRGSEPPINYSLHINSTLTGHVYVAKEELRHKPVDRKGLRGQPLTFIKVKNGGGWAWVGGKEIPENRERIEMATDQELAIDGFRALQTHPEIQGFREFMKRWYLSYFVPELARRTPVAGAQPHLDRTGENLANYLQYIERERRPQFKQMLIRLGKKIPGLERIDYDKTEDGNLILRFFAQGFEKPFFQRAMSDGTLKLLAYLLLMEDPAPASFVGIEEPENGLYHQLLSALADELKDYAQQESGPQVLLATHAPNLVDALSPSEVWVLNKDASGFSSLTRAADMPGVQALYDEGIPMGSLWFSNHLHSLKP
ncbi:MAG: AAA family ATPase [Burkholderiaceae bacterium]